jgi:L-threonylcarbamoyladenylate synthase
MIKIFNGFNLEAAIILNSGGIGVIPTDTIYGIAGSALNEKTVERIYRLRKRNLKKPMIILIGGLSDLKLFGIKINAKTKNVLAKIWPDKISVILPCEGEKFYYLHRGAKTLAFRLPRNRALVSLIRKTGPLVAPSANWEGFSPAENIKQAKKYFGDKVDFYIDVGAKKSLPSTLIGVDNGKVKIIRGGAVNLHTYA